MTIDSRAPGKVVLWGEYAVLAGAPALVMAVDRYAHCRLVPGGDTWRFVSRGYSAPSQEVPVERLRDSSPPPVGCVWYGAWHVLQALADVPLPAGGLVELDTAPFYLHGSKLGLGSSAASCVALLGAFSRLIGRGAEAATALRIHQRLQDGQGSGIDIAAAWQGGTLRFQRPPGTGTGFTATPWQLPAAVHVRFVWAGAPAATADHLRRLQRWRESGGHAELDHLSRCSEALFNAKLLLPALRDYVEALDHLDRSAGLGIFSAEHAALRALAMDAGVVYKPCGAGGGDIGAAFAANAEAAELFVRRAAAQGFESVPLETAPHGIEVAG